MDDKTRAEIIHWYQVGTRSIQDIARIYRVEVAEVLEIIGERELSSVDISGDLIDATEAGPNAEMNYGQQVKVPFTTD
jgi:hypothetical protein